TGARRTDDRLAGLEGLYPGGLADRGQALHVGEVGQHHLTLDQRLAVGVAGEDHPGVVDLQTGQLAGGVAVLAHRGNGEGAGELGGCTQINLYRLTWSLSPIRPPYWRCRAIGSCRVPTTK